MREKREEREERGERFMREGGQKEERKEEGLIIVCSYIC